MRPMLFKLMLMTSILLFLGACSSSPRTSFYQLSSSPIAVAPATNNAKRIMVGPVALPAMLDQAQLVVQSGSNEVRIFEYQRWAGSLKSDVGRVIAANIARELNTPNVWNFSESTQTQFDYQVLVDVQNVDSKLGEEVVVDVLWTIRPSASASTSKNLPSNLSADKSTNPSANHASGTVLSATEETSRRTQVRMGRSLVREPVSNGGIDALVAAESRAFAKVGYEIAQAMR